MPSVIIDASEVAALGALFATNAGTIDVESATSVTVAAQATEEMARSLAPVLTGRLRDSIRSEGVGTEREVIADSEYAVYVEFGTSRQAPQPFMFPAGDLGERILEEMSEEDVDPFRA